MLNDRLIGLRIQANRLAIRLQVVVIDLYLANANLQAS